MKDIEKYNRYLTRPEVAEECFAFLEAQPFIAEKKIWIEPSAGAGDFLRLKPGALGFDLEPKGPEVIQQDFFKFSIDADPREVIIFGAPPIGHKNTLAIRFIKHALMNVADHVAFVLPGAFSSKEALWRQIPDEFDLYAEKEVDEVPFYHLDRYGNKTPRKSYVVFQIWYRNRGGRKPKIADKIVRNTARTTRDFKFTTLEGADLVVARVGGKAGQVLTEAQVEKYDPNNLLCIRVFENEDSVFDFFESGRLQEVAKATGARSVSQTDVIKMYGKE